MPTFPFMTTRAEVIADWCFHRHHCRALLIYYSLFTRLYFGYSTSRSNIRTLFNNNQRAIGVQLCNNLHYNNMIRSFHSYSRSITMEIKRNISQRSSWDERNIRFETQSKNNDFTIRNHKRCVHFLLMVLHFFSFVVVVVVIGINWDILWSRHMPVIKHVVFTRIECDHLERRIFNRSIPIDS